MRGKKGGTEIRYLILPVIVNPPRPLSIKLRLATLLFDFLIEEIGWHTNSLPMFIL